MSSLAASSAEPRLGATEPLHLLHVFPSFAPGGVQLRIASVINDLGSAYRHTVVSLDRRDGARSRVDTRCRVSFLCSEIEKTRPVRALWAIARILRRTRPDLLLTYNWGSIEWAAVNRVLRIAPHIHLESGFGPEEATVQLRRRTWARRLVLSRTGAVVVPSENLVRIATDVWKLDPALIRLIPNGVDCARFVQAPDRTLVPGIERAADALMIGTVAPLRPEKNLGRLVRAFARVASGRNAVLVLVGDGAERSRLAALAEQLGISDRVLLPGHVETPELVYGLFDLYAMSSDTEQMPNSLIQAMAAGRPVVATDVGDVRSILAAENRPFVVPTENEPAFDAALARLIDDPGLRSTLGVANQARAREVYPQERMFAAYRAILGDVLAGRSCRTA